VQVPPLKAVLADATATPEHQADADTAVGGPAAPIAFEENVGAAITTYLKDNVEGTSDEARAVVVVDQFAELFTLCQDQQAREIFIDTLRAASATTNDGGPAALVVIGLRADFYSHCLDYPVLAEALQNRQMLLGPMTLPQLREAITGPARAVGLRVWTRGWSNWCCRT
jgi:hypothetical protein